jgi:hypothetical protein
MPLREAGKTAMLLAASNCSAPPDNRLGDKDNVEEGLSFIGDSFVSRSMKSGLDFDGHDHVELT